MAAVAALASLAAVAAAQGVPAMAAGGERFHSERLVRVGTTTVRDLPARGASSHAASMPARHTPRSATPSGRTSTSPAVVTDTATAPAETVLTSFPAMSLDQQVTTLGAGQNVAPPDTQLAAGPTSLLELLNDSGSVWSKSGVRSSTFDMAAFFHVPSGEFFSDPRVIFDAPSGRWFASGLSFSPPSYGSRIYIAVSSSSDPAATWTVYSGAATSNVLHDQPKIGVSSDKLVMSWNDFLNASFFEGATTWVMQKSDLLAAAASPGVFGSGPDSSKTSVVPVQDLAYASSDTTAYAVFNTPPNIGVLAITGTPALGNVSWVEHDLSIGSTSTPPNADQPGAPGSVATNDDRFLSAVWQQGTLWTSGNDGCVPSGDTVTRPCARFVAVTTGTFAVAQDFDLASSGTGLYYPAVTLDSSGNMVTTYAVSSMSVYPGVRVSGESGGVLASGQTLQPGQALYNDDPCYSTTGPSRWGDYSAAAVDPSNPGTVWIGAEYSVASTLAATTGCAWSTFAAQLSFGAASGSAAAVSPTTLAFPDQLVSSAGATQQVTVTNLSSATAALAISGVVVTGTNASDFVVPTATDLCSGHSLAPGTSCTVGVSFAPTAAGSRSATLAVNDNASGSPQTVSLSGRGLDFSVAATPSSVTFRVSRSGQFSVTVTPSPSFAATFTLSASSASSRLMVTPASQTCTTSGAPCTSSAFTITASRQGTYTVVVAVKYGGVTHTVSVTVTVTRS